VKQCRRPEYGPKRYNHAILNQTAFYEVMGGSEDFYANGVCEMPAQMQENRSRLMDMAEPDQQQAETGSVIKIASVGLKKVDLAAEW
jgi:hypothetical protein